MRILRNAIAAAIVLTSVARAEEAKLFAWVGAGIKEPVSELASMFEKESGATVEMTFGNSGTLLSQIALSRKGDILMPGSMVFVRKAKAEGLVDTIGPAIAYHVPIVIVPKGNPAGIHAVADLARPGVKLVLPDRKATALGKSAFAVFEKLGIAEAIEKNVLAYAETPQKVVTTLSLGQGDAGIVDWSNVAKKLDAFETVEIDPSVNVVEELPCSILSGTADRALALRFLEFVGKNGPAVFARHGFRTTLPGTKVK